LELALRHANTYRVSDAISALLTDFADNPVPLLCRDPALPPSSPFLSMPRRLYRIRLKSRGEPAKVAPRLVF
jgi:hypothetical protein